MYTIYYIYYNDILLYIGSTTDFNNRKMHHKSRCYNENCKDYKMKLYEYIRDNDIIFENLVWKTEETNITDTTEARKYEGSKILELNPLCNCVIAGRTREEWYQDNQDRKLEYQRQWNEANNERKKQWYEKNKEKINEKSKQWYEDNREQILEKAKQWYEKNRERILERQRLKYHEKKNETKIE